MTAHWTKGQSRLGFTPIYVVDEHGCMLNTEPACSVPDRYSDWFLAWLLAQPCPYRDDVFPLLEHRPSFAEPTRPATASQDGAAGGG